MSIDALLAAATAGPDVVIPDGWGQGRATFGGLIGALLVARLQALVPEGRRLRSFSLSFVGPVAPGPVALQASLLRSGKSVTQGECRLVQGNEVLAVMLASFGTSRPSAITVAAAPAPVVAPAEAGRLLPRIPGVLPDFMQKIDMSWVSGELPFSGAAAPDFEGWMRFHDPVRGVSAAHLVALVDAWPPAVIPLYNTPAPASTLTWTLELLDVDLGSDGNAWWQYRVRTDAGAAGYAHSGAHIWRADGTLVAISRQTVTVFV